MTTTTAPHLLNEVRDDVCECGCEVELHDEPVGEVVPCPNCCVDCLWEEA